MEEMDPSFYQSLADEFIAKLDRLSSFTGHGPSTGAYREEIVKSPIRQMFSERFSIKTGFIYGGPESVSRQLDILIVDEAEPSPYFFKQNDFVVVHPSAVACVIEVKTKLTQATFLESLKNVHLFREAARRSDVSTYIGYLIFSFKSARFTTKNLTRWYKGVKIPDELQHYPHIILSLEEGMLYLRPESERTPFGHSLILGEEESNPRAKRLSIFLSTIRKFTEIKAKIKERNPFEFSVVSGLTITKERFCYGKGLIK